MDTRNSDEREIADTFTVVARVIVCVTWLVGASVVVVVAGAGEPEPVRAIAVGVTTALLVMEIEAE